MHDTIAVEKHEYAKGVSWVVGQCYVIDIFLWFMAKRGYTLQRSRARLSFKDVAIDVGNTRERSMKAFADLLASAQSPPAPPAHEGE